MFHGIAKPLTSPPSVTTTMKLARTIRGGNSAVQASLCVCGSMFAFQLSSSVRRLNQTLNSGVFSRGLHANGT